VQVPTHFEPQTDDYLGELIEEDERRHRRRRAFWISFVLIAAAVFAAIGVLGYEWTQTRFYVGIAPNGNVAIFQGVQQQLGPWRLSHVYRPTGISGDDLNDFERQQLTQTTNPSSLSEAERIVEQLSDAR
jgi:protein phosphatase